MSFMNSLLTYTPFNQFLQAYENGKVVLYELRSGYNGVSLAVKNNHSVSILVTITCKVLNALSHTGNLKASKVRLVERYCHLNE